MMNRQNDGQTEWWTVRMMNRQNDECAHRWIDRQTNGWIQVKLTGRMSREMDVQMERETYWQAD